TRGCPRRGQPDVALSGSQRTRRRARLRRKVHGAEKQATETRAACACALKPPKRRLDLRASAGSVRRRSEDSTFVRSLTEPTTPLPRSRDVRSPTSRRLDFPQRDVLDFRARAGFAHLRTQRLDADARASRAQLLDSCSTARLAHLPAANRLDFRASSGS